MISRKTADMLEFSSVLEKLASRTVSEQGREKALGLQPEETAEAACLLMEVTKQAETLLIRRPSYPMKSFPVISSELARLNTGASLNAAELLRMLSVYRAAKHAYESISHETGADLLKNIASGIFYDEEVIRATDDAIENDGSIKDSASDNLYRIRKSIRKENEYIREKLQSIIKGSDISASLQDSIVTQRNGRYVVPVKKEFRSAVSGIVHAQSGSGSTLFIEPTSVVEANNRISELVAAEEAETELILANLSSYYAPFTAEIRSGVEAMAELDVVFAKAAYAVSVNAAPVEFSPEGIFRVKNGRHPLIDPKAVIPIDVEMDSETRSLVITGPNTGGKTVTLKMCGLFALMAQSGMFVPADFGVKLPFFDSVFADIGDEQSISQNLSTFSSHLKNITYILRHATGDSLVLLDELGAGTEPQEGSALAMAVLDSLSDRGSMTLVTTHYSELKKYASGHEGFENASMEFDAVALRPTYRLMIGIPGMSNALLIAKRLGLRKDVLDRAFDYLGTEHRSFMDLMGEAQKAGTKAKESQKAADYMREQAERMLSDAKEKLEKAEARAKKIVQDADEKALEIVSDASSESEDLIAQAKKLARKDESERTKVTKEIRDRFDTKKTDIRKSINRQKRKSEPIDPGALEIGSSVRIVSMDVPATVLKLPDSKGNVSLQAGIMKIEVHFSDLEFAQAAETGKAKRTSSMKLDTRREISMEIDLHGMAVDDACIVLDKYLDDALISGLTQVYVIHGRGTGVLRAGVRDFMRKHPHVKSMRDGNYDEGGVGCTVVELK